MGSLRIVAGFAIILATLGVLVVAFAYWQFTRTVSADLVRLASGANSSNVVVTNAMLAPLPHAAQRYLRYAGVVNHPIPKMIHLTQRGRIRSSEAASWMNFEADEAYSTSPPQFVWRTWLPARLFPVALCRD